MLEKLPDTLETMTAEGKIKTKWSEIEDYGLTELVHLMCEEYQEGNEIASTTIVEKGMVYLHMYEGVMYEYEGRVYTLAKAYIDVDNNIIFATPQGELFLYETQVIDAYDPKHTFGND